MSHVSCGTFSNFRRHVNESCLYFMSWVNESCLMWDISQSLSASGVQTSEVSGCVMSHVNESCRIEIHVDESCGLVK